jgi:hypothetical protein
MVRLFELRGAHSPCGGLLAVFSGEAEKQLIVQMEQGATCDRASPRSSIISRVGSLDSRNDHSISNLKLAPGTETTDNPTRNVTAARSVWAVSSPTEPACSRVHPTAPGGMFA